MYWSTVWHMEEMVNHFASQFVPTEEEQQLVLVVEGGNAGLLRTTKFVLVGKVLTKKPFNKEAFKRAMATLWRPKAQVEIVTLEDYCSCLLSPHDKIEREF